VYKLLLCVRYLRTRYLAFVCIVSVMLGVATLIVVNSVMSGFSDKLKDRLHGILSDVLVETERSEGFAEPPKQIMERLATTDVGKNIEAMAPTAEVSALLQFSYMDRYGRPVPVTKPVRLIGIDPKQQAKVGNFSEYLVRQKNSPAPSFDLTPDAWNRYELNRARDGLRELGGAGAPESPVEVGAKPGDFIAGPVIPPSDASPIMVPPPILDDSPPPRLPGVILGYSIAHFRYKDPETGQPKEAEMLKPGDDVLLVTYGAAGLKPAAGTFVVADYFHSEMSEYDSSFVYVPLEDLQRMRGADGKASTIQVRLKDDVRNNSIAVNNHIVPQLQSQFHPMDGGRVVSWQQHQGPLLAAIDIERGILNLLLFMIVGVAGFSVLAIFTMIVTEKFRDIGILKSLGASDQGIMGIFLGYGMLLGTIGCACGTVAGLAITHYINEIEMFLTRATGEQIFDRSVYYFDRIPTNVEAGNVLFINIGAVATAVAFSVLPALRAARLHPVRALRFE
jgi:lipoprotein-releasing system permease protein